MNILYTETLPKWGGQQNKVLKEMKIAASLGNKVFLVCQPNSIIGEKSKKFDIEIIYLKMNKKNYFKTVPFFLKLIKEKNIDLIFSNGSTDSWIVAISGNLSRRKPFLIRERHNIFVIKGWLSKFMHRKLFDRIIAVSKTVEKYLVSIGVKENKIVILPSTVDINNINLIEEGLRRKYNIDNQKIVIGILATTLSEAKGTLEFIMVTKRLLKKYGNIHVVLSGEFNNNIKNEFISDRITWTGFVENSIEILKGFDIFLYPSHSEGLSMVVLEAMASKLPIVSYDLSFMRELVKDGENGFTVPFKNIDKLEEKVEILINNKEKRSYMSNKSYEIVSRYYTDNILEERLKKLLEGLK